MTLRDQLHGRVHDNRGVSTWGETVCKAKALDDIAGQIARYLSGDGRMGRDRLIAEIIGVIEARTNYLFIRQQNFGRAVQGAFHLTAGERQDVPQGKDLPHGNQPPNPKGTEEATKDNDLTTGHSRPGDGGDDNAKAKNG